MTASSAQLVNELQQRVEDYRHSDRELRRENNRLRRELAEAKSIIHRLCELAEDMTAAWGEVPDGDDRGGEGA